MIGDSGPSAGDSGVTLTPASESSAWKFYMIPLIRIAIINRDPIFCIDHHLILDRDYEYL
jgi:hypothetical protein